MESSANRRTFELKWGLIAVGWILYACFFTSQIIVTRAYVGRPLRIGGTFSVWLICSFIWLGATPFILNLARRFPLERHRWIVSSLVHLAASLIFSAVLLAIYVVIISLVGLESGPQSFLQLYRNQLVSTAFRGSHLLDDRRTRPGH